MNAAIIILIIILVIAILVGIGVGLYFAFRKKPEANGNGNGGTQPVSPISPGTGDPVPPGTGSPGPPGTDLTTFSISPVTNSGQFITFTNPTTLAISNLFVSSDPNIPCENYAWQNLTNVNLNPQRDPTGANTIPSVLKSNSITFTQNQTIAFPLMGKSILPGIFSAYVTNQGVGDTFSLTFSYDNTTKRWCGPANEDNTGLILCLYLEPTGIVSARPSAPNDSRFEWDIVPPFTCTSS